MASRHHEKILWNIPKSQARLFSRHDIEQLLDSLNPIGGGNFFVVDFCKKRIITGSSSHLVLTGHAKELLREISFNHYFDLLNKDEREWLDNLLAQRIKLLNSYPENERTCLVFHYTLNVKTASKSTVDVHHKFLPYQFDKNGNLWLGLCFVSLSLLEKTPSSAYAVNSKTGEKYDFIDGEFQLTKSEVLTHEDLNILRWLANDYTAEEMCTLLGISDSNFKRKKRDLLEKLGVETAVGAVHKAHLTGLI